MYTAVSFNFAFFTVKQLTSCRQLGNSLQLERVMVCPCTLFLKNKTIDFILKIFII